MKSLALALALGAGACSPALPSGSPIDAGPAYEALGSAMRPQAFAVATDCNGPEGSPGFWLDGACRGGLSEPGVGIYIVVVADSLWSDHFAHELAGHWNGDEPCRDPGHTGAGFAPGGAVDVARMTLFLAGDANTIHAK